MKCKRRVDATEDITDEEENTLVDEDGQYRLFSEGQAEEGTELKTAAQRLAASTVSSVAQRLSDIGVRVRLLSSQAEARALVGEDAMIMVEDVRELIEAMIKTKSSINDNTQPSQSDVISGAISSNADGAATVVSQRTNDEIANINKNTSAAKNFIKRFKNSFDEMSEIDNLFHISIVEVRLGRIPHNLPYIYKSFCHKSLLIKTMQI